MFCGKCGNHIDGVTFCPHCGNRIVPAIISGATSEVIPTASGIIKKSISIKKKIAIIGASVVFLLGVILLCLTFFVSSPQKTVKNMIAACSNEDIDGMMDCYSPKTVSQYESAKGVANIFMGLFGVPTDSDTLINFAMATSDFPDLDTKVTEVKYYKSGNKLEMPKIISNTIAEKATVTAELYENGELWQTVTFELRNYGNKGWLIEEDLFEEFLDML